MPVDLTKLQLWQIIPAIQKVDLVLMVTSLLQTRFDVVRNRPSGGESCTEIEIASVCKEKYLDPLGTVRKVYELLLCNTGKLITERKNHALFSCSFFPIPWIVRPTRSSVDIRPSSLSFDFEFGIS